MGYSASQIRARYLIRYGNIGNMLTKEEIESLGWIPVTHTTMKPRWFIPWAEDGDKNGSNWTLWDMQDGTFQLDQVYQFPVMCFYEINEEPITDVQSLKKAMKQLNREEE